MLAAFFSPETAPFASAIILMLNIMAVELASALIGVPASAALESLLPEIDADLDIEADYSGGPMDADALSAPSAGPLSQFLGWLCVGKAPVLVLLVVFLTAFGLAGFFIQFAFGNLVGIMLPSFVAVVPAFLAALPLTRASGLLISRIMPKEQTEAVSQKQFIGKVATIVRGEARRGVPAEAKLTDSFGQAHYILVEPDDDGETFSQGSELIVVKQLGSIYRAIVNTSAAMTDDDKSNI